MSVKISFIGDIALNNRYSEFKHNSPFDGVKESLLKQDFVVGNLEAFAEGKNGFNELKKPYLYSPDETLKLLSKLPLNLVTLANNHLLDTYEDGLFKTKQILNNLNIEHFGIGKNEEEDFYLKKQVIKNKSFLFINSCHKDTHPTLPKGSQTKFLNYNVEVLENIIKANKNKFDFIIVLPHWGGTTDYGHFPDKYQIKDSRTFINAGASAIIGHHSHCIQPVEFYKGKPIIYSLGNFCFDDIVCHGQVFQVRKTGKVGYIAQLNFGEKISLELKLIRNDNLKLKTVNKSLKSRIIQIQFFFFKILPFSFPIQQFFLKKIEPKIFYLQMSEKNILQMILGLRLSKIKQLLKS